MPASSVAASAAAVRAELRAVCASATVCWLCENAWSAWVRLSCALPRAAMASESSAAVPSCRLLRSSSDAFTTPSSTFTTTSPTVLRNVELMVRSSSVAPVSMILVATGADFSLT